MTTDEGIVYDRNLLGVEHSIGSFRVSRDMITGFARSTGETKSIYLDDTENPNDLVAPPTICNIFVNGVGRPDIKLEFGDMSFFAGQSIECKKDVRPGDTLNASTRLDNVYAKTGRSGKMVFAVWQTTFKNQNGDTVALVNESFVRRNRAK
ncbi:MAG: MaoC family dehydratase N-terminal domain-containing protein [Chloroflexota bacterium]|nr:MaoC family dehydratase N-terminal domain-containing protein [Chloroflexota bacterium]